MILINPPTTLVTPAKMPAMRSSRLSSRSWTATSFVGCTGSGGVGVFSETKTVRMSNEILIA